MTSAKSYDDLARLLAAPDSTGPDLLSAARELREGFVRSDHLIGLLPGDASDLLVAGLERAGHAGESDAWLELGRLLAHGAAPWAPYPRQDVAAAIAAYRRADALGSRDGALGWIRTAYFARSVDHAGPATGRLDELVAAAPDDAELLLLKGYFTHQGYGGAADPATAVRWHRAAADRGNAAAAFELGVLYATGSGVPPDPAESDRWTRRAAELGSARAMANLAGMYATGRGVPLDPTAALDWYAKAADAGHGKAAYTAGVMCALGDGGLPVDEARAARFFDTAQELGFPVEDALDEMGLSRPVG